MKHKYLYFLFFCIHISINAIPTAYTYFNQSEQHRPHPTDLWPTQQYKHHNHYNSSYNAPVSLPNCSRSELQRYFDTNDHSEKNILSYDVLYMSDEFVELAKTHPCYEKALVKLYNKLKRLWWFQKGARYFFSGTYYPNLLKRTRHLYKELREYQLITTEPAKSFAHLYDINLLTLLPHNNSLVTRNIYKDYIDILDKASNISLRNGIMRDCIGQASSIGLEANKHGYTEYASQLADFCFTMLDCAVAVDEGIYLGALQTVDAITHPIETVKNGLVGIGVIALGLSKLISVPVECAFLYVTDQNSFHLHINAMSKQLVTITQRTMQYLETTPPRNIVKQGAAFITEGVLLAQIGTFAHNIAKRLQPIARNYFEYVAKSESIAFLADGTSIEINIPKKWKIPYSVKPKDIQRLKPLGRGNTGKSTPRNLHEKLVLEEIISDPAKGFEINIGKAMTDPRWHQNNGWIKMGCRNKEHRIEIHYVAKKINNIIVAIDDFKFKEYL